MKMVIDNFAPAGYCKAAYTRPSPIDALTFPPWSINATIAVAPRSGNEPDEPELRDCCLSTSEVVYIDQCWATCEILLPPSMSDSRAAVTGPRPDDLSLTARGLAEDGVKAFENCMSGKGVDIRGMNPKAEYRVVGTDGRTKPLESGGGRLGCGLSMTGLGLVGLVCLVLMA